SLFITCYNDMLFPETGKAVVRVLERLGHEVEFPLDQTCCGQMHFNTGFQRDARDMLRRFVRAFEGSELICAPSSSCVAMIREQYPKLADGDSGFRREVDAIVPRVFEVSELLVDRLAVEDVGASYPHRVSYHPSCHSLRSLRLGEKPLRLLRKVQGLTL